MAEYINKLDAIEHLESKQISLDGWGATEEAMGVAKARIIINDIPNADVIERSKLIELQDSVKELEKAHVKTLREIEERAMIFERENRELRSKINKAIEDIEDLDPITERVGLQVKQEILNILKEI